MSNLFPHTLKMSVHNGKNDHSVFYNIRKTPIWSHPAMPTSSPSMALSLLSA